MGLRGDKKASEKYYIIISLILGIMILALVLYFIFQEYFTQDTLDWENCRQSIVLRGTIPENYVGDIKSKFPLKCKTFHFDIDSDKPGEVEKEIADISASSFYLVGEGNIELFPKKVFTSDANCLIISRISFNEEVRDNLAGKINLWDYMKNNNYGEGKTYLDYVFSNFVYHPFIKKGCPSLTPDSRYFLDKQGFPEIIDPNKDIFIFMIVYNKGKAPISAILGNWVPSGVGIWDCAESLFPKTFLDSYPSLKEFYITQDESLISDKCDYIETIPA